MQNFKLKLFFLLFLFFFLKNQNIFAGNIISQSDNLFNKLLNELKIDGWKHQETLSYPSNKLWKYIDGADKQFQKFSCLKLTVLFFSNSISKSNLNIEIYSMLNNNCSFGIFTTQKSMKTPLLPLKDIMAYGDNETVFFRKGKYYGKIQLDYDNNTFSKKDIKQILALVVKTIPGKSSAPSEVLLFPSNGLVKDSIRYVCNEVLGIKNSGPAFIANYNINNREIIFYYLKKKSKSAAEKKIKQIINTFKTKYTIKHLKINGLKNTFHFKLVNKIPITVIQIHQNILIIKNTEDIKIINSFLK